MIAINRALFLRSFALSILLCFAGPYAPAKADITFKKYYGYISGYDAGSCFGTVYTRNYPTPQEACAAWVDRTESLLKANNYCSSPPSSRTPLFSGMKGSNCVIELKTLACKGVAPDNSCPGGFLEGVMVLKGGPYETTTKCPTGMDYDYETDRCYPVTDRFKDMPKHCPAVGRPIHPLTGSKSYQLSLAAIPGIYDWIAKYDTREQLPGAARRVFPSQPSFGTAWFGTALKSLSITRDPNNGVAMSTVAERDGARVSFENALLDGKGDSTKSYVLTPPTFGEWGIKDLLASQVEIYSYYGLLRTGSTFNGQRVTYEYSSASTPADVAPKADLLIKVADSFGRSIRISYKTIGVTNDIRIAALIRVDGERITFDYDANSQLTRVNWPDGNSTTFSYEQSGLPWALTSVTDESGHQVNIYGYDNEGRGTSTESANGVGKHSVTWASPPQWNVSKILDLNQQRFFRDWTWQLPEETAVTMPNGEVHQYGAASVDGSPRLSSQSQSAGSGCLASVKRQEYDAGGNVAWQEDFKGNRTCYANNATRNVETSRVEGLATNSVCDSVMTAGATLPPNSRRISTEWHPVWRVETRVAEPRRITTKIYNGQPDPFSGGTASCANSGKLPDNSPVVVLCKQVEQATTDVNGTLGFSATLDASVPTRTQQWTYNQYGQLLTAKDPLGNTTTNTYYSDTTADHTMGDLATVTNALSQVTARYTKYNAMGQWLEMVDANSVTTIRTFDLRQRLKSSTINALTTSYDYWPTGLLKSVTLPDASFISYGYDDAQRLTSVADNLGNKITYTLDNSGNRIAENVTDPSGKLARTLTRIPDALNRIQEIIGRP